MQGLEIALEDHRWQAAGLPPLAAGAMSTALHLLGLDPDAAEISLLACDDARIAELNAAFRGKPAPTNVLSWPSMDRAAPAPGAAPALPKPDPDGTISLGDIAISYDTCAQEAAAAGKPFPHHVTHLIVHGTLHLLGYDHETDVDAVLMEGLEVKILGKLGLDDPYRTA